MNVITPYFSSIAETGGMQANNTTMPKITHEPLFLNRSRQYRNLKNLVSGNLKVKIISNGITGTTSQGAVKNEDNELRLEETKNK